MPRPRKRSRPAEDFQMAPMIDMVFLLLVFFMCVSTLAQAEKGPAIDLPASTESKVPENLQDRATVSIEADGSVLIGKTKVDHPELMRRLKVTLGENPRMRLQVRADQNVSFAQVKIVLKTCAEAGAYEIIYATNQTD
jgi:biopolymer transport protein ExbD